MERLEKIFLFSFSESRKGTKRFFLSSESCKRSKMVILFCLVSHANDVKCRSVSCGKDVKVFPLLSHEKALKWQCCLVNHGNVLKRLFMSF